MSFVPKRIEESIKLLLGMVEFVTDVTIGADGKFTALGAKSDDDDGHPIKGDTAWHLGFYSRPLDGGTGAVVKPGGKSGAAFLFCWRNRQYEVALEKGEVAMANEAGALVKLDKDGNVYAIGKAGQKVYLGGNSGTEPAVLGNTLQTRLADLESKFIGHIHPYSGGTGTANLTSGAVTGVSGSTSATASTLPHSGDNIKSNTTEVKP